MPAVARFFDKSRKRRIGCWDGARCGGEDEVGSIGMERQVRVAVGKNVIESIKSGLRWH